MTHTGTAAMRIAVIALYLRRFLLAWLVSLPLQAAAGVDPALLAPLSGDDTNARLQAIAALGELPDPGAAAFFALRGEAGRDGGPDELARDARIAGENGARPPPGG